MAINLRQELVDLLKSEGLGRKGLLRKTTGSSPVDTGGEYDPNDPRYWEGRSYLDYEITYYYTPTLSAELKSVFGTLEVLDEIAFIAADIDPLIQPTQQDTIVPLKHDLDGNVQVPYLIDDKVGFIRINSVLGMWGDNNGAMVYWAVSSSRSRTGWGGRA